MDMKLFALLLLAVVLGGFVTGCATTSNTENASERPWNAQRGWEHGLPSSINEGR